MSIINNGLLLASEAAAAGGYQVSRSLRFNSSDSVFLSRTPASAGNRKTWTWAGWVKRSGLGSTQRIFSSSNLTNTEGFYCELVSGDTLSLYDYSNPTIFWQKTTSQVFRDASAWFHLQVTFDSTNATAGDRVKLYVNGVLVTAFSTSSNPSLNYDSYWNAARDHAIGRTGASNTGYFSGYLADIHFIDGQALDPTSFTEVSATTGQLIPKAYTGSFGTNGFWLKFSDNSGTTSTTLGKDAAGSNNWTPNNFSVAAGAGNDSLVDTPTSYGTDTGAGGEVRGNYATFNPLDLPTSGVYSNGNLEFNHTGGGGVWRTGLSTFAVSSGKWYWEMVPTVVADSMIGIVKADWSPTANSSQFWDSAGGYGYLNSNGNKYNNGSGASYGATFTTNDVIGVALDLDAGTLVFYKNGVSQGTAYSSLSGTFKAAFGAYQTCKGIANFGQRPFAYTAPSGFKALCDTNLPSPLIAKPSSAFDCVTYTGTGATLTPTSSLGFSPDLVWIKSRSAATDHTIYDAVRGTQARLESNNTDPEVTSDGGLTAFNSNGFTLGTLAQVNTNAATYVAWCWDEAVADGFDIVTYTGNGANRTIAHSLGVSPSFMIVKQRTAASATNWAVWHSSLANTEYLLLNSTAAKATGATYWNSTSPTSTNFSLGTAADVNTNNGTYVAYLWSSVVGYSSFGSYVGTGTGDGPFVYTGFRPRWIMVKSSDWAGGNWTIIDAARDTYNVTTKALLAENSAAEQNYSQGVFDILSNGFKVKYQFDSTNRASTTFVYAAFAESPFQYARAR